MIEDDDAESLAAESLTPPNRYGVAKPRNARQTRFARKQRGYAVSDAVHNQLTALAEGEEMPIWMVLERLIGDAFKRGYL